MRKSRKEVKCARVRNKTVNPVIFVWWFFLVVSGAGSLKAYCVHAEKDPYWNERRVQAAKPGRQAEAVERSGKAFPLVFHGTTAAVLLSEKPISRNYGRVVAFRQPGSRIHDIYGSVPFERSGTGSGSGFTLRGPGELNLQEAEKVKFSAYGNESY